MWGTWRRRGGRGLATLLLIGACALLICACGGSSRSDLSPAAIAPADTAMYLSVDVPSSGQIHRFQRIVTEFAGAAAWKRISTALERSEARKKVSWKRDVAPWIGNSVGIVFTNFAAVAQAGASGNSNDPKGFAAVFPTNNIKAAMAFAKRDKAITDGATYAQDGHYLLFGDPTVIAQLKQSGPKLSGLPAFQAEEKASGETDANAFINLHTLAAQMESLSSSSVDSSAIQKEIGEIPAGASFGMGLRANSDSVVMNVVYHDLPAKLTAMANGSGSSSSSGVSGTVAGLPAGSFLALAANLTVTPQSQLYRSFINGFEHQLRGSGLDSGRVQSLSSSGLSEVESILPALGPLQLAVGGTSLFGVKAGLSMDSRQPAAAGALLTRIFEQLRQRGSVPVTGTARNFAIAAGPFRVRVTDAAGKILALLGYTSAAQLISPTSTLASTPAYKAAVRQLPSGAKVPLFINFSAIRSLLSAFSSAGTQKAKQVLSKLGYLVVGTAPGDVRVVLGLH